MYIDCTYIVHVHAMHAYMHVHVPGIIIDTQTCIAMQQSTSPHKGHMTHRHSRLASRPDEGESPKVN